MAHRERKNARLIYFSDEEIEIIEGNMFAAGTSNFSRYARKMMLDGYIVKRDFSDLKPFVKELGALARNIHQIAKRANETRHIYASDLEDIREAYNEACSIIKEQISKVIRKHK